MRAARLHGNKDIRIDTLPEPECGPGKVKIQPAYVGICGSDIHAYYVPQFSWVFKTHPLTGEAPPITLGHEICGIVSEIGDGANSKSVKVGDAVVINPVLSDGDCSACKRGVPNCCQQIGFIGLNGGGGGLSDAMVLDMKRVFPLPKSIPTDIGALIEPLAVGWHAVALSVLVSPDAHVLVIGGGPIGCAVLLALQAKGVTNTYVSEPSASRRTVVSILGAKRTIDPTKADVPEEILQAISQNGVDIVFDCAGVQAAMDLGCAAVRARGEIITPAIFSNQVRLNSEHLQKKEAAWRLSMCYSDSDIEEVIEALEKANMDPRAMITGKIRMEDVVAEGFEVLNNAGGKHCKILIDVAQR